MVAMVACINKLTHIIFALLKTGKAFDPEYEARLKMKHKEVKLVMDGTEKRLRLLLKNPSAPVSKKNAQNVKEG